MYKLLRAILEAKLSGAASQYRKGLRAFHNAKIKGDTQVQEPDPDGIVQNAGRARMRSNPTRRLQKALRRRLAARKQNG